MPSQPKQLHTIEEYLAMDREADFKSEYVDGQIFAKEWGPKAKEWGQVFLFALRAISRQLYVGISSNICHHVMGMAASKTPCHGRLSDKSINA